MKIKTIVALASVTFATSAMAATTNDTADNAFAGLKSNTALSEQLLNTQNVMGNQLKLLKDRQSQNLTDNALYIGGSGEVYSAFALPNYNRGGNLATDGKYVQTNSKHTQTYLEMPYANVYVASTIGKYVTGYAQLQTTSAATSNVTLPQAYFILGDLSKTNFYLSAGKSVVNFGQFNQVNNYNPTMTRAFFMQYGATVSLGYAKDGINVNLSAANGDSLAVSNMTGNDVNQINAYTADIKYSGTLDNDSSYVVGMGLTNATGFTSNDGSNTGAIDFNAMFTMQGMQLSAEFVTTLSGVDSYNSNGNNELNKGTGDTTGAGAFGLYNNPVLMAAGIFNNAGGSLMKFDSGSTVKALSLQAQYDVMVGGKTLVPYVSYSQVMQNSDNQAVLSELGARYNVFDSVWVGGSYTYAYSQNQDTQYSANVISADATAYF